jgi:hypothetical protein
MLVLLLVGAFAFLHKQQHQQHMCTYTTVQYCQHCWSAHFCLPQAACKEVPPAQSTAARACQTVSLAEALSLVAASWPHTSRGAHGMRQLLHPNFEPSGQPSGVRPRGDIA